MSKASNIFSRMTSISESLKPLIIQESESSGWCLYYTEDTKVPFDGEEKEFKKNEVIEGPFKEWSSEDAKAALKEYDADSKKNLKAGYVIVKDGFVVDKE